MSKDAFNNANQLLALLRTLDCPDDINAGGPMVIYLIIEMAKEKAKLLC